MRNRLRRSLLAVLALVVTSGCREKSAEPTEPGKVQDPATAVEQLRREFKAADPLIQQHVQLAVEAVKQHNYQDAFGALQRMRAEPHLNFAQDLAVRNAMMALQKKLAEGTVRGAPEASKAAEDHSVVSPK